MTDHDLLVRVRNSSDYTLSQLSMASRNTSTFVPVINGNLPKKSSVDEPYFNIEDSLKTYGISFKFKDDNTQYSGAFKSVWKAGDFADGKNPQIELTVENDRIVLVFMAGGNSKTASFSYNNAAGGQWKRGDGGGAVRDPNSGGDELLPGCMYLGLGYNLTGSFDISGVQGMARLFDTGQAGDVQYAGWIVPKNVRADTVGELDAQTKVFEDRADVSEFFGAKAGLKAGYMGFSGTIAASFDSISKRLSEYFFGMSYYYTVGYEVKVDEQTLANAAAEMQSDPDVTNLPDKYVPQDPQIQAAFFRFFEKYGTAFVSSVRMGGRLFYNAWIDKSHGMTSEQVTASLKAEYGAVFNANASVDWKSVDQRWINNRQSSIQAWGGDAAALKGLADPRKDDSYYSQYAAWVDSVSTNPAPVSFGLTDIAILFSGARADAIKQASADFRGRSLRLQSLWGNAAIQLSGAPAAVSSGKPTGMGFVVMSRSNLSVLANGLVESNTDGYGLSNDPYAAPMQKLAPYIGDSSVIIAVLFWNLADVTSDFLSAPSPQMYDLLHSLGASDGLAQWGHPVASGRGYFGTGSDAAYGKFSYAVVGVPGSNAGDALEDFMKVTTGDFHSAHPSVNLEVLLSPESDGARVRYSPE
jgi:MAC/Perforin domain